jgi:hypothetical protein
MIAADFCAGLSDLEQTDAGQGRLTSGNVNRRACADAYSSR